MLRPPSKLRFAPLAAALVAIAASGAQDKPAAPAPQAAAQEAKPAENKPATYVGSDTCQTCHEDIFKAFQANPHHLGNPARIVAIGFGWTDGQSSVCMARVHAHHRQSSGL